jgi:hypothetical protein
MFNSNVCRTHSIFILVFLFTTSASGQQVKRFALFNNSDKEIKVVTSPIIRFEQFPEVVDTSLKAPKLKGDTGALKLSGIFFSITRLNMKIVQHDVNKPDTGIYLLQPHSALPLAYNDTKQSLSPSDITIDFLQFYTATDTVKANNKNEIWSLKDNEKFKWKNNSTIFSPRKPIFTYSIYVD